MASRIFLIRHGETDSNAARIVQTADAPLSAVGLVQARHLGRRLAAERVGDILSSDLRRAVMTAESVRDAVAARVRLDPLLQERNFGDIRGRPYSSLAGSIFDLDYHPPGGESWEDFHARVDGAWEVVRQAAEELADDRALAVITHGLVLHSLLSRHLAPGAEHSAAFANTSVTTIEAQAPWRVTRLNCVEHLEDAGPTGAPV